MNFSCVVVALFAMFMMVSAQGGNGPFLPRIVVHPEAESKE